MTLFWEQAKTVDRFAEREPDHRLVKLVGEAERSSLRVLDVGCAAGRNTFWLVAQGADVYAVDASAAMVTRIRERLSEYLGREEAEARVQHGHMEDLHRFADNSFNMVLGLGIYQQVQDYGQFQRSLAQSARVLEPGGICLVANFGPDSQPQGIALEAVAGERDTYTGFMVSERMVLPSALALDAAFAQADLFPKTPTETVRRETALGYRTTINALYQKGRL